MTDKFTVRDLLVYFMTGLFLFLILLHQLGPERLFCFFNIDINKAIITDNSLLAFFAGFLLIPALYILGQLVCSVNGVISRIIGEKCIEKELMKLEKSLPDSKRLKVIRIFDCAINGNRLRGVLKARGKGKTWDEFWKRVYKLRYNGKADSADYWNFMGDLFQCLTLICFVWVLLCAFKCEWIIIISIALTYLSWERAKQMKKNFVDTVINTWDCA